MKTTATPKPKKYDVISPDGFSIHFSDTYPSKKKAREAFEKWKKNFERQGYYSSTSHGRIPLEDLEQYCELKPIY